MKIKNTDVVAEYLHEVDLRLTGLPVLQRRELLADLAAHIATERTERNIQSEGELIEVLERLGSPEVVANAAYEEAGTRPRPAPGSSSSCWSSAACSPSSRRATTPSAAGRYRCRPSSPAADQSIWGSGGPSTSSASTIVYAYPCSARKRCRWAAYSVSIVSRETTV
jgi:hypothetical protein